MTHSCWLFVELIMGVEKGHRKSMMSEFELGGREDGGRAASG